NLRHLPETPLTLVSDLGCDLEPLLGEMSAPCRILLIDGADSATEDRRLMLTYLLTAAQTADVRVVAVVANDSRQVVGDLLREHLAGTVLEQPVPGLSDQQLADIA